MSELNNLPPVPQLVLNSPEYSIFKRWWWAEYGAVTLPRTARDQTKKETEEENNAVIYIYPTFTANITHRVT